VRLLTRFDCINA
jgi:hypothetical protein